MLITFDYNNGRNNNINTNGLQVSLVERREKKDKYASLFFSSISLSFGLCLLSSSDLSLFGFFLRAFLNG
jgi:hypothetical protein